MAKLRMAHASTHGARKPPGPKKKREGESERETRGTMEDTTKDDTNRDRWYKRNSFKFLYIPDILTNKKFLAGMK